MYTLESLRSKTSAARDLKSVVSAMKAMASSNIVQYQTAVSALGDYYHTVALGIIAYFRAEKIETISNKKEITEKNKSSRDKLICAIVFGSDQGLVGQFNDSMADFVSDSLRGLKGKKVIWAVGERMQGLLADVHLNTTTLYPVPNTVDEITPLVQQILTKSEESLEKHRIGEFYIFHNQPKPGAGYQPVMQRFLPLDEKWKNSLQELPWPTPLPPQIAGGAKPTLLALVSGYLFVSLFKACAESLASENASRLEAMQRAEKNIGDLLDDMNKEYHRLRQRSIDEELFDVVSGFEALKNQN
jgi:F-type H+-transporting ATPase subunit gamma